MKNEIRVIARIETDFKTKFGIRVKAAWWI